MDRVHLVTTFDLSRPAALLARTATHLDRLDTTWQPTGVTPSVAWRASCCREPPSERVSAAGHASALPAAPSRPLTRLSGRACSGKRGRDAAGSLRRAMALQRARGGGVQARPAPPTDPQFCFLCCGCVLVVCHAVLMVTAEAGGAHQHACGAHLPSDQPPCPALSPAPPATSLG